MKDCWLSPYGEVIYVEEEGKWLHCKTAAKILNERYNYNYDPNDPSIEWLDILHSKGWVRYSHFFNTGWIYNPYTITTDQKNKIYELTGDFI